MDLIARTAPPVGAEWTFQIANIPADAHSLTVEMYEANGGIARLFPRGRTSMDVTLILSQPGRTLVCVVARDETLKVTEQIFAHLDVGNPRPPPSTPIERVPVMGVNKPSYAFPPPPESGYSMTGGPDGSGGTDPSPDKPRNPGDLTDLINARTEAIMNRLKRP
ncbi:MAG: hypothetical protein KDA53_03595 [Hyphomonas sp.]|nr:hypothetical protein [Hyphomonas sp.]